MRSPDVATTHCAVSFGGGRLRIGLLLHALSAFERERHGLLLAIRVNGARLGEIRERQHGLSPDTY